MSGPGQTVIGSGATLTMGIASHQLNRLLTNNGAHLDV